MWSCWGSESLIFSDCNRIWACFSVLLFSFAAPETGALDCECCAPGGASSPRRNLRDHRSQLRFVGEAIGYVDAIQLVVDFHRAVHLRPGVWQAHRSEELRGAFKEGTDQWRPTARDSLLSSVSFQRLSDALKSIPRRWNLSQRCYLKLGFDRICLSPLTELVWLLFEWSQKYHKTSGCALWIPNLSKCCRSI